MFLVILDEACVHAYESPAAAACDIEALDAGEVRAAFDIEGRLYDVEWIRPNQFRKFLGLTFAENGLYRFSPTGVVDRTAMLARLATCSVPPEIRARLHR